MGFGISTLQTSELKNYMIMELYHDKVLCQKNEYMTICDYLYFDDDIKEECFRILSHVNTNFGSVRIEYELDKIYGIQLIGTSRIYVSSKVSPTSYGWVLDRSIPL